MEEKKQMTKFTPAIKEIEKIATIKEITEWNKNKVYPVSPIHISIDQNGSIDNSNEIGILVCMIGDGVEDAIKNTIDAESLSDVKKTVSEIGKFIIETRKIQTNPLAEIAKKYTKHEAKFNEYNAAITKRIDEIKELEYEKAEKKIVELFEDEMPKELSLGMFRDFISNKRKNKIFTAKGELTGAIKSDIAEAMRIAYEPIKFAVELDAKKNLQSKQFETYIDNIETDGATNILNASIITLERFKEQCSDLYPDILEGCYRTIANKAQKCEANIRANEAVAQKEATVNADASAMKRVIEISDSLSQEKDLNALQALHKELQEIYKTLTFSENQLKVKEIGTASKQKITAIEVSLVTPKEEEPKVIVHLTNFWMISIHDLEPLTFMKIEADTESDAKKKMVEAFESHLSMVTITKIGA